MAILARNSRPIAAVTVVALVLATWWAVANVRPDLARVQILMSPRIIESVDSPNYQVEVSRTIAVDHLMDSLQQVVTGSSFVQLVADKVSAEHGVNIDPEELVEAIEADRTHRGLTIYVTLASARESRLAAAAAGALIDGDVGGLIPSFGTITNARVIDVESRTDLAGLLINGIVVVLAAIVGFLGSLLASVVGAARRDRLYLRERPRAGDVPLLARLD